MVNLERATICVAIMLGVAISANAQTWTGAYAGGSVGRAVKRGKSETVRFDTNLDGRFGDTVRTAAGVDAFSPGFCPGLAVARTPGDGCTDDDNNFDFGGHFGYDLQFGAFVVGGLADISRADAVDHVTAFSTTPAFYAFTRELKMVAGFRGRFGVGNSHVVFYGTGGAARGSIDQTFTTSNAVNTFVGPGVNGKVDSQGVWAIRLARALRRGSGGGGASSVNTCSRISTTARNRPSSCAGPHPPPIRSSSSTLAEPRCSVPTSSRLTA
jgi:hypothetical protein